MKELKKIDFSNEILSEEETMEILGGCGDTNYTNVCVLCQDGCTACSDGCTSCTGTCTVSCTSTCTACISQLADVVPL